MPKKKKGGKKKKGKKGKGGDEEAVEETDPLYDTMDARTLEEVTKLLRQQLAKAQLERNYVQLERDTTQSFFDITKSEVNEVELMVLAKEREAELKEDNHRTEVRVYVQKVRHLEYEHAQGAKRVRKTGDEKVGEERDDHTLLAHPLAEVPLQLAVQLAVQLPLQLAVQLAALSWLCSWLC